MRELTQEEKETIYLSLLHLGVIKWSKSCYRMLRAMEYIVQHDDITNIQVIELYADVAKITHSKWQAVERSLRIALQAMWKSHPNECSKLFFHSGFPVPQPSLSVFLYLYKLEFDNGNIKKWNESIENPKLTAVLNVHQYGD